MQKKSFCLSPRNQSFLCSHIGWVQQECRKKGSKSPRWGSDSPIYISSVFGEEIVRNPFVRLIPALYLRVIMQRRHESEGGETKL